MHRIVNGKLMRVLPVYERGAIQPYPAPLPPPVAEIVIPQQEYRRVASNNGYFNGAEISDGVTRGRFEKVHDGRIFVVRIPSSESTPSNKPTETALCK